MFSLYSAKGFLSSQLSRPKPTALLTPARHYAHRHCQDSSRVNPEPGHHHWGTLLLPHKLPPTTIKATRPACSPYFLACTALRMTVSKLKLDVSFLCFSFPVRAQYDPQAPLSSFPTCFSLATVALYPLDLQMSHWCLLSASSFLGYQYDYISSLFHALLRCYLLSKAGFQVICAVYCPTLLEVWRSCTVSPLPPQSIAY